MSTSINTLMEEFEKEFPKDENELSGYSLDWCKWNGHGHDLEDAREDIKAFLRQAISKTCDEILASVPRKTPAKHEGHAVDDDVYCYSCRESIGEDEAVSNGAYGWNSCRQAIESKIRELKG